MKNTLKIEENKKYRLKEDGSIWEVYGGIEYPMDSRDPKFGVVFLLESDGTNGMQVMEDVFWKYFESVV